MLRHGELPFWNQYIFSGTPLMADFNAGAFYPLMGLFVALPDRAAWIATEVVLFSAIAIGMYAFLRALKLSTVACFLGAATFAFAGPVLSQVNHVDMTEGFAAIPWMLLAVHHIVRDGRWRWAVVLGIAYATVILGGAPEAMLDEALLVIAYAVISAGFSAERWWKVLSRCATGAALALSLAAIQWLPGLEAIRNSQRGAGVLRRRGQLPDAVQHLCLGAVYRRRVWAPRGGTVLQPLQPARSRDLSRRTPAHCARDAARIRGWPSRIPPRDRLTWYGVGVVGYLLGAGLEHAARAILQPPTALRPSTTAEPQHDHRWPRPSASSSQGGSTVPTPHRSTSGGDATTGSWHWCPWLSSWHWSFGH